MKLSFYAILDDMRSSGTTRMITRAREGRGASAAARSVAALYAE